MEKIETLGYDWLAWKGESNLWNQRFLSFYLIASLSLPRRSPLICAYDLWLKSRVAAGDLKAKKILDNPDHYPDRQWQDSCKKFEWEERSKQFRLKQISVLIEEKKEGLARHLERKLDTLALAEEMTRSMLLKGKKYTDPSYQFHSVHDYRAAAAAITQLIGASRDLIDQLVTTYGLENAVNSYVERAGRI